MEPFHFVADLFLHLDEHLEYVIDLFGILTYVFLFLIIFAETGLIVAPFLPGDSLLFAAGALAGAGHLNIALLYISLVVAAIAGDSVNYFVGRYIGPKVFSKENSKVFRKEYLEKTREFYDKHGGKAIILARFLPIIRTFAPFVAGVGKMHYKTFFIYNVVGAFLWVTLFTFAGYFFGGLPFVEENFHYVVFVIIGLSLLPMLYEYIKYKKGPKMTKEQMTHANYKEIEKTISKE